MTSTCTIEATDHAHEHVHASHQMIVKRRLNAHGEVAKHLRRCTEQIPTIDYNTCPAWLRDNDFIRDGYRKPGATFGKYLASIVHIHNETGNIWTHLVGAFIFLVVFGQLLFDSIPSADKTILGVYALCAACCMLNSAYYHTFCCQSKHAYQTCMMIDLSGICAMITGSFYPLVYSCFYGDEFYWTRVVYLTCITVLGTVCAAVSFLPYFSQAHCRPYRTALYGSLGMLGFVPYLHELCHFGLFHERTALITPPLLSVFAVYFTGAIIFVSRIPERFSPGKFDLLFQSHQLWHVFVFLGAWTHFCGCYHILQVLRSATEGVPAL